jgi:hypothetical protein
LWRPARLKRQIVRRHIDGHREQNAAGCDPKERAVVDPPPMRAMHQVWAAMLLKLGIIHGAGDRCEKWIGHLLSMRSFFAGDDTGEEVASLAGFFLPMKHTRAVTMFAMGLYP